MSDINWAITFENFQQGFSPAAHIDTKTFIGDRGQASEMLADVISRPGYLTQSPGLADLTNGTQAGVVDQLIRFILDQPTEQDATFAVGTTKLFKLSSTAVVSGGSPSWPQTITDMTGGESVIRLKTNLFVFYNKFSGGDIAAMPLVSEVIDPDWGSTTDAALENAPHPAAAKEDILVFGNGRYLGTYVEGLAVLDVQKLDFGEGAEVVDVVFNGNTWWIAVNSGEGKRAQIYVYDGSAISNILSDEAGIGDQQIGFLYVQNGMIFVAYEDKTSGGFIIGWLSGRQIKPLRYFSGTLPNHRQKALYKNTLLFLSGENVWSAGAAIEQLPYQISTLAPGGHTELGAIASPFGEPMVSSTDGDAAFRIAKFSGYSTDSSWKSVFVDVTENRKLGKVQDIIVLTKPLLVNARCDISLEGNQGAEESSPFEVSGTDERRFVFKSIDLPQIEDIRVHVNWENGDTINDCPIRKIIVTGNFAER